MENITYSSCGSAVSPIITDVYVASISNVGKESHNEKTPVFSFYDTKDEVEVKWIDNNTIEITHSECNEQYGIFHQAKS